MYYEYDENGYFIQQLNYFKNERVTNIPPPDGLFKPCFDGVKWFDALSEEEKNDRYTSEEKSDIDILKEENEQLKKQNLDTMSALADVYEMILNLN
ncbi:hypothetical protein [Heyndrickxia camelliae]|uniref:Uncharacterized protein n=1 Tax=Heyndrickxia camelliae TaxID=1707093 RepID=A0A2N3LD60_9BACI|nr:hypothetical protein [Heyndrickxia camelliae]PKR82600.1 hypothetical protein CWO92_23495 [Heyndrickxia camelliae]